ncbi:hypothetical protein Tco_0431593 [Tanacetum coccineum]
MIRFIIESFLYNFNLLADKSDSVFKKFNDELAHIISPPEYDCYYFDIEPDQDSPDYEDSRARGFVQRSLDLHPFACLFWESYILDLID